MRRHSSGLIQVLAILLLMGCIEQTAPSPIHAQVTRADSAAILLNAARLFQDRGRWEAAEALYQLITERYADTEAGALAAAALAETPQRGPTRSAQVELMVWATTYGAWLGLAIPGALGANDSGPFGAGLLVGAPAGFLGGRALARSRPFTLGQARAITFGSFWGTWQGYGLMEVLDLGEEEVCDLDFCSIEGPDGADVFKALVLGGLAGTAAGALLSRKPVPDGAATAANLGALWGTWFGLAGGLLADLDGDGLLTSTLLVGDAGLLGAALLAPGWEMSRNRARLISIAGVIGGLAGAGIDLLVQPDDEKVAIGIPLAGSIAGLALGANLTSELDRGPPRPASTPSGPYGRSLTDHDPLIQLRSGRVELGYPTPFLSLVPVEDPGQLAFEPALGFTIFHTHF